MIFTPLDMSWCHRDRANDIDGQLLGDFAANAAQLAVRWSRQEYRGW
jgi:hypothetical protein